jgi:hypothetical protein
MTKSDYDETRAIAHLPQLDVEIVHRRPWEGNEETISITLKAVPSFDSIGRFLEASNPVLTWMRFVETAWNPWLNLIGAWPRQIGKKQ